MDKTNNLDIFMTDLADSIREATGETGSINAQSFSTRITGLGTGKQDKLVSGENIKTINGESILGSGDIEISGGGSSSDTKREVIYLDGWNISITNMRPNVIYYLVGAPISIESFEDPVYGVKTYDVFTAVLELSDSSFTLPDYIVWANGVVPEFTVGEYELSISRISDGDYSQYYAVLTPFKSVE